MGKFRHDARRNSVLLVIAGCVGGGLLAFAVWGAGNDTEPSIPSEGAAPPASSDAAPSIDLYPPGGVTQLGSDLHAPRLTQAVPTEQTVEASPFPEIVLNGVDLNEVDIELFDVDQVHAWVEEISTMQKALKKGFVASLADGYSYSNERDFVLAGLKGALDIYHTVKGEDGELRHVLVDETRHPDIYALRNAGMKIIQSPSYRGYIAARREELHSSVDKRFPGIKTEIVESEDGAHYTLWATVNGVHSVVGYVGISLID